MKDDGHEINEAEPAERTRTAPPLAPRSVEGGPARCPNCGAERTGKFCSECGQNNRAVRLSVKEISSTGFEHIFELDVPILRTVVGLTVRPGKTCREYVSGQRRKYSNPIRYCVLMTALYLVCLALFDVSPSESVAMNIGASKRNPDGTVSRLTTSTVQREQSRATPETEGLDAIGPVNDRTGTRSTPERTQRIADYVGNNGRLLVERNINWLAFFSIPIGVLAFSLLFRKRRYTYGEQLAWGYFVFGHIFLYSSVLAALGVFSSAWGVLAVQTIEIIYAGWAAYGFYGYGIFGSIWRTVLGYLAYTLGTIVIGIMVVVAWASWLLMSGEIMNRI